jgi:hypothetical protein
VTRFEQFIKHRQYLLNVSANTIRWYRRAFKWLPPQNPTHERLNATGLRMRASGLNRQAATRQHEPSTLMNAYLHWSSDPTGKFGGGYHHPRIIRWKRFPGSGIAMDDRIALIAAEQRSALFGCEGCSPSQDPHFCAPIQS